MIRVLLSAVVLGCSAPLLASLYEPKEPFVVPVKTDGVAEPLPFDEYQSKMVTLANIADANPVEGKPNRDRAAVLERVRKFQENTKPTTDELAAHCTDLLRLGQTDPRPGDPGLYLDRAANLLVPHTRDRTPNYFLLHTLVQVYLGRGGENAPREALNLYDNTMLDAEMPATVKGWTGPQQTWLKKFDETALRRYLQLRIEPVPPPDQEEPLPLFPLPEKNKPSTLVKFVNESGQFEPGKLAAAERAKLPADAIPIVQQLLFLFPADTRLHWLLAELYAADDKLDEANTIFFQCAWGRKYGNRALLMEHRHAVEAELKARWEAAEKARIDAYPIDLRTVWIYFAGVVLVAGFAIIRSRMRKAGGSQPCCGM